MNWKSAKELLAALSALLLITSIAYPRPLDSRPDKSELKKQLQEYRAKEIKPFLEEQKALLDSKLDKQSLEELNKLRAEAKSLKKNGSNTRSLMRDARKSGDETKLKSAKEAAKGQASEFMSLAEKLKPIIKKNPEIIKEISARLKEKSKIWKEEIQKKTANWREANKDKIKDRKIKQRQDNSGRSKEKLGRDEKKLKSMQGKRAMARFMLWDGESAIDPAK